MKKNKGNSGPLVASIIIVLVLLVSGIYAIKERPLKTEVDNPINNEINILDTQGTSTELSDIEADLNAVNIEGLDAGIDMADSEI